MHVYEKHREKRDDRSAFEQEGTQIGAKGSGLQFRYGRWSEPERFIRYTIVQVLGLGFPCGNKVIFRFGPIIPILYHLLDSSALSVAQSYLRWEHEN
ncbi:hypothetical protein OS493_008794 [Desmophyllum pertusum]|uniref:Uncharacterized protein n=1 Tax=Desmophyllum pertusum TaxID=174260 RepID=A0A9W9ZG09_9CNID|nr:hypothetical protein OS493_008794 [Desmophyllum pertusum]